MNPMVMNIPILILAAGASTRMGEPKQLLPWEDSTLLGHAIEAAKNSTGNKVYVVLGAHSDTIQETLQETQVHYIKNPYWEKGMGSSISYGVKHLIETERTCTGIVIMLCDQPLIDTAYIDKLIDKFNSTEKGIVASGYTNKAGVPAVFDKKYLQQLISLNGDIGARDLIKNYADDVLIVEIKDKKQDIDTWKEYADLKTKITGKI